MADEGKELGAWVGLAKLAEDQTVRKSVRCSVAVIADSRRVANLSVSHYLQSKKRLTALL